ncbi:MAG: DNA-processing protein DprA [Deltaproteobacteria bacterium]|nr:DNA-processing protein DprA [Deltaproteobacteria bacterium]
MLRSLPSLTIIDRQNKWYPSLLIERIGKYAPPQLWTIGTSDLLQIPKTALFCSKNCPGDAILSTMDQAQKWRDQGRCIISGFHSPIEKECLDILMRGRQPIIICPARSLGRMKIPQKWQVGIEAGQILLLSPFEASQNRLTAALAEQRNLMVAALADEVYFGHITPGGKTARLAEQIAGWKSNVSR